MHGLFADMSGGEQRWSVGEIVLTALLPWSEVTTRNASDRVADYNSIEHISRRVYANGLAFLAPQEAAGLSMSGPLSLELGGKTFITRRHHRRMLQ